MMSDLSPAFYDREEAMIRANFNEGPWLIFDGLWVDHNRRWVQHLGNCSAEVAAMSYIGIERVLHVWTHDGNRIVKWARSPAVIEVESHDP